MKITLDGVTRALDMANVKLKHAVAIQEYTGLSLFAWQQRLTGVDAVDFIGNPQAAEVIAADPAGMLRRSPMYSDPAWILAVAAACWLMLAQNGEAPPLDDEFNPDVLGFYAAFMSAVVDEATAKAVPDKPGPTVRPGRGTASSRQTGGRKKPKPPPGPLPRTGS